MAPNFENSSDPGSVSGDSNNPGVERELKLAVPTFDQYLALRRQAGAVRRAFWQQNLYFDSRSRQLAQIRSLLRIRRQGFIAAGDVANCSDESQTAASMRRWCKERPAEVCRASYKRGTCLAQGYFQALEIEADLDDGLYQDALRGSLTWIETLDLGQERERLASLTELVTVGYTLNLRTVHQLSCQDVLELDCTVFPSGKVECEAEVETLHPDLARSCLEQLALANQVQLSNQQSTKYERFLADVGLE